MILIDTNVYSASNLGAIEAIAAQKQSDLIYLPAIVIGELRTGFLGGYKKEFNNNTLNKFMSDAKVKIATVTLDTTNHYAELADYAKKRGRALSNNDVWIAALAKEHNARLVTYDKDFEVFADIFGDKLLILSR